MAKDKILKPFLGIIAPENKFTVDTLNDLKGAKHFVLGDVVEVLGFHAKGDGSHHKRIAKDKDDGSGELGQNGIWWCLVENSMPKTLREDIDKNREDIDKLDEAIDFNLLATLGIEYGGILNNTNAKTSGKAYYDTTGKKLYKCIANTSINYADAGYFEALSNNDLLGGLKNLNDLYGTFDYSNHRTEGNIDLVNFSFSGLFQSFSVPVSGVYLIISTQRVSSPSFGVSICEITKNDTAITSHPFHCGSLIDNSQESQITISAVAYFTPSDVIKITRNNCLSARPQRSFTLVKLK